MSLKHMVVTYVAQSRRLPHLKGVFANRILKQFTSIEIIPHAYSAMYNDNSSIDNNRHTTHNNNLANDGISTTKMANECSLSSCKELYNYQEEEIRKHNVMQKLRTVERVIRAPPYVCNMITAPQHTISLRRFLALRHQFHKDHFLHINAEHGWYLLAPSYALGLHDEAGLIAWSARHHAHDNTSLPSSLEKEKINEEKSEFTRQSASTNTRRHDELQANKPLTNMFELSEEDLEQIAREEEMEEKSNLEADSKCSQEQEEEEEEEEEELEEKEDDVDVIKNWTYHTVNSEEYQKNTSSKPCSNNNSHQHYSFEEQEQQEQTTKKSRFTETTLQNVDNIIPSITEEQLFEINDGVHWTLPPHDDLASTQYWKTFKDWMHVYEHNDGWGRDEFDKFVEHYMNIHSVNDNREKKKTNTNEELPVQTQKELYDKAQALFEALTFKANVALEVEPNSSLVTLITLKPIDVGEELCLHYGREWWTTRLLSRLFCSANDAELKRLRWIESVCAAETDEFEPFPLITLRSTHKHSTSDISHKGLHTEDKKEDEDEEEEASTVVNCSKIDECSLFTRYYLYNTVTRSRAKDHAILAYAVRRSCTNSSFLKLLLHGLEEHTIGVHETNKGNDTNDTKSNTKISFSAVFDIRACDAEVPLRRIRRALLLSLYLEHQSNMTNSKVIQNVTTTTNKSINKSAACRVTESDEAADLTTERVFDV